MIECEGVVVRDDQVFQEYRDAQSITTPALRIWPRPTWSYEKLVSFTVNNLLLVNRFISADTDSGYLFLNQTYSTIGQDFLPPSFELRNGRFKVKVEAKRLAGRFVVIGGPVDGNWWHWLYSWCPRLMLLKRFRPELFADPKVRFVVHPWALKGTFWAILETFGIPVSRFLPLDLKTAHVLEEATLVSFCDQELHYPALMQAFASYVRQELGVERRQGPGRRVFASRQGHSGARRRVSNWDETAAVLAELEFEIHSFGTLSARQQIQIYADADVVVGVHGSDLATLIFCRPGTKVLVFETQRNADVGLYLGLEWLCKLFHLEYKRYVVKEIDAENFDTALMIDILNRDVVLDAGALDALRQLV